MPGIECSYVFHTSLPPEDAARLGVMSIGHFRTNRDYGGAFRDGWRAEHLIYTLSGAAIGNFGGQRVHAAAGTLWFMPKDIGYRYWTDPEVGTWEGRWIEYDGAWSRQIWKMMKLEGVLELPNCSEAAPVIAEIFSTLQAQGNAGAHEAAALLMRLLALAGKRHSGLAQQQDMVNDPVTLAQRYVSKHVAERIGLPRMARAARLSPYHFARIFRARTGFTPAAYTRAVRISRAQELLRREDLGLKRIALEVGFPSIQHFCNVFKRETGLSPGAFARAQRGR